MYYYGIFYCDELLRPVMGQELLKFASDLKFGFAKADHIANVYVWSTGVDERPASKYNAAFSEQVHEAGFGAPVNLFVELRKYLDMEEFGDVCGGAAKPMSTPSRTYFVVPYRNVDLLWNPDLGPAMMNLAYKPDGLKPTIEIRRLAVELD